MITKTHMAIQKQIIRISAFLIFMLQLFATVTPVSAQTAEEKNFLLMYFKEEELVVESSTRSPKPVSQVAENVTVVTAADIELMNAHTLADVLNTITGVQMWLTGGPGQMVMPFIQGSETKHVTVLIDGVVVNDLSDNVAEPGMIPVQNIAKIEIIKGPASSAWGSALGGVVNIITKAGSMDNQGGAVSASYGKRNTGDFRAEARGKQDKFGYYLTAGRLQSDGLTPHYAVSDNNAYVKLTHDLTEKTGVLFAVGYEKNTRETGIDTVNDMSFDNIWAIMHSTLAINSALSKDLDLNISIRTIRQEITSGVNQLSSDLVLSENKYRDEGYGSSAKLTWKNTIQTIVLGTDYDDKTYKSDTIAGGEQGTRKWAVFANDTLSLNKFSVTPGIRYDKTNTNGDLTSPSLGMTYGLAGSTILRAYAARGFSIPTLGATFGDNLFYTANPDLKMETVWSYQAGVETTAVKYLWIKLSAFRNEIRDAIISESTSTIQFTMVNSGRQRRQGLELEVRTTPVFNTAVSAGAEFIDARDLDTDQRVEGVPTHVYDLGLHYDDEHTFKALLKGRFINYNTPADYYGKYNSFVFDLHMIKKIYQRKDAALEAFVDVHNIGNGSQYWTDSYKNPVRWFEGGMRYTF